MSYILIGTGIALFLMGMFVIAPQHVDAFRNKKTLARKRRLASVATMFAGFVVGAIGAILWNSPTVRTRSSSRSSPSGAWSGSS